MAEEMEHEMVAGLCSMLDVKPTSQHANREEEREREKERERERELYIYIYTVYFTSELDASDLSHYINFPAVHE